MKKPLRNSRRPPAQTLDPAQLHRSTAQAQSHLRQHTDQRKINTASAQPGASASERARLNVNVNSNINSNELSTVYYFIKRSSTVQFPSPLDSVDTKFLRHYQRRMQGKAKGGGNFRVLGAHFKRARVGIPRG